MGSSVSDDPGTHPPANLSFACGDYGEDEACQTSMLELPLPIRQLLIAWARRRSFAQQTFSNGAY